MAFIKNLSHSRETDEQLLAAYKSTADMALLSELFQRYMELIYGVCLKYLEDREPAKDAVLDIFEELVIKLQKHEVINFKAWVYQLAKNHCLMKLRAGRKFTKISSEPELMQNEELLHLDNGNNREEQFKHLELCLQQLQDEQKIAIELFYLQKKCYNEIVEQTGMEWNKVRSHIQNGRRNLKICMDKQLAADS
ncbi:MAG TPA: sigma-70 family RNA polymerase sigma factor [Ferruginibacter sp.]|nr:sigma-70 family RNA polymerase sigma factor [Ferruginibacter sp.]HMU24964.1 sigma-70 family RNA polymerase sigma factor [Ferruginibacter sp.]